MLYFRSFSLDFIICKRFKFYFLFLFFVELKTINISRYMNRSSVEIQKSNHLSETKKIMTDRAHFPGVGFVPKM